ncbi:MAG: cellulase family glycosylhydrolase [Acidobacteriia bacterium]|nr:cellulase family glycosylhydrolase [Terriglobia bacterium]
MIMRTLSKGPKNQRKEAARYIAMVSILAWLLCISACSGAVSPDASSGGGIPATLFGMHLINKSIWPTVSIGALGKGTQTLWPYVEKTRGVFDWSNLDAWVNEAQSMGVSYFFSPEKVPPWAAADPSSCAPTYAGSSVIGCTSMVTNIQDWDNYVTALVTRYKGRIQIYELWNEPNGYFTGTMADLVTLTTHMYKTIRSIDPAAIILSPSPSAMGSYIDDYFAAGGPTGVDGISFHAYDATPEKAIDYVNNIKQIAAKYGLASKPLWNTEGSWGTASLTSDTQVAAVARFYLLQCSNGVSRFYWYAWDGGTWGPLWDAPNGPHPAALAYQQVYDWMVGARMTTPCSVDTTSTWTCGLSRPGGYQAQAIWNTTSTLSYTPPSNFTRYSDLAGHAFPITGGSVVIGPKPILLETSAR